MCWVVSLILFLRILFGVAKLWSVVTSIRKIFLNEDIGEYLLNQITLWGIGVLVRLLIVSLVWLIIAVIVLHLISVGILAIALPWY